MKRLVVGLLMLGLAAPVAAAESWRERVLASGEVGKLWPLDAHYSYFEPAGRMSALYVAMVREGLAQGGIPEVLVERYDSFTRATTRQWAAVELFQTSPGGNYYYHHPDTGKQEVFGFGDLVSLKQAFSDDPYPPLVRMRGVFTLLKRQERAPHAGRGQMVHGVIDHVVLQHDEPQPFVYRDDNFIERGDLVPPPTGLREASAWDFRPPQEVTLGEAVKTGLSWVGGTGWQQLPRPYGDRITHAMYLLGYGGVCANYGGELSYLMRDTDGLLITPSWARVYHYFVTGGRSWNTDLFLSCNGGARPFAVNLHTAYGGQLTVEFRDGTTAEQILAEQPDAQWEQMQRQQQKAVYNRILAMPLYAGIGNSVKLPSVAGLLGPNGIPGGGALAPRPVPAAESDLFDAAARQAIEAHGDLVVPGPSGGSYEAYYNGVLDGCDHVAVSHVWREGVPGTTWNYRFCDGTLDRKQMTQSPGLGRLEQEVSRAIVQARLEGLVEQSAGELLVRAVRMDSDCSVEVRVFDGMQMKGRDRRNACQN